MPASQQPAHLHTDCLSKVSLLDHFEAILPTGVLQPVHACAYGVCVRVWMADECACER